MDELQLAKDLQLSSFLCVAMTCWAGYEWAVLFPEELHYVWRRRLTLPRVLFAFTRLLSLGLLLIMTALSLSSLSLSGCMFLARFKGLSHPIISVPTDGLLLRRVVALFSHRPIIRNALVFYFLAQKTVDLVVVSLVNPLNVAEPYNGVAGCAPFYDLSHPSTLLTGALLPAALVFHLTWMMLTIYNPHTVQQRQTGVTIPILQVLRRGATAYFAIYLAMLSVATFLPAWYGDRPVLQSVAIPILVAGHPIAVGSQRTKDRSQLRSLTPEQACRLYLHLKRSRLRDLRTTDFTNSTLNVGVISRPAERRRGESYDSWSDDSGEEVEGIHQAASATATGIAHRRRIVQ